MITNLILKAIMSLAGHPPMVNALYGDAVKRRRDAWKPPTDSTEKAPPQAPKASANPFAAAFLDLPVGQRPAAMAASYKLQAQHDERVARRPQVAQPQAPATRSVAELVAVIRRSPFAAMYRGLSDVQALAQFQEDRAVQRSFE